MYFFQFLPNLSSVLLQIRLCFSEQALDRFRLDHGWWVPLASVLPFKSDHVLNLGYVFF